MRPIYFPRKLKTGYSRTSEQARDLKDLRNVLTDVRSNILNNAQNVEIIKTQVSDSEQQSQKKAVLITYEDADPQTCTKTYRKVDRVVDEEVNEEMEDGTIITTIIRKIIPGKVELVSSDC